MDIGQSELEKTYAKSMLCTLQNMRSNRLLTDVIIECGEHQFYAHRVVLSAGTQYFRAMFSNGMRETNANKVCLQQVDPEIFELVLDFLYSGLFPVALEVNRLLALLSLVDEFDVVLLYQHCWEQLLYRLSCDNFSLILEAAVLYAESNALQKLVSYFAVNAAQIQETKAFLNLSAETLRKLLESFKANSMPSRKRNDLITSVVHRWARTSSEVRICSLSDFTETLENELECNNSAGLHSVSNTDIFPTSRQNIEMLFLRSIGMCHTTAQSYSITNQSWQTCKLVPCVLNEGASAALCETQVCFIGGRDSAFTTTSTVLAYDYANNVVWKTCSMTYPRQHCGVALLDGVLYVVGGWNSGQSLKTAECYSSARNQWQEISPMIHEHSSPSAVVTLGRLYVVGSYQSTPVIEQYQPFNNQWVVITYIPSVCKWSLPLVSANWGKIYLHNRTQDNSLNVFDCESKTWMEERLSDLPEDVEQMWASGNGKINSGLLIFFYQTRGIITVKADTKEVTSITEVSSLQPSNKIYVILMHS